MRRSLITAGAVLLTLAACATGGASSRTRAKGSRNVITSAELQATPSATNALEAVRRLRPQFLQAHGEVTLGNAAPVSPLPVVFLDNQRFGTVGDLQNIRTTDIEEIRFFSSSDATTRWGTGYPHGVIQVVTRK
jgi:hypothetical protein